VPWSVLLVLVLVLRVGVLSLALALQVGALVPSLSKKEKKLGEIIFGGRLSRIGLRMAQNATIMHTAAPNFTCSPSVSNL